MISYITLPNSVASDKLSCSEAAVLVVLYDIAQRFGCKNMLGTDIKVKQNTIAARLKLSVKTITRCLDKLIEKNFIVGKKRTVREDRTLTTYVYTLPASLRYFRADRKALKIILSDVPDALREYLFCCKCRTRSGILYHSYNDIADALHIKRSDVINHVALLVKAGAINKKLKRTRKGCFTENTYVVLDFIVGRIMRRKTAQFKRRKNMKAKKIQLEYNTKNTICQVLLEKILFKRRRQLKQPFL